MDDIKEKETTSSIFVNQPPVIQEENTPKPKSFNKKIMIISIILILLLVPLITIGVLKSKSVSSRASSLPCEMIQKVEINPGEINTYIKIGKVEMSALAYDFKNNPILKGVKYRWGISSSNSIGKLITRNTDISSFVPLKEGIGDIYVRAINKCTANEILKSIPVTVSTEVVIPSISQQPSPTKTKTITPFPTRIQRQINLSPSPIREFNINR